MVVGASGDGAVDVGVDRVLAVRGRGAGPLVGGVVLREASGGIVPLDGIPTGGSRPKGVDDVVGLFEAGDAGADAQVVAEPLVDLAELGLDVRGAAVSTAVAFRSARCRSARLAPTVSSWS